MENEKRLIDADALMKAINELNNEASFYSIVYEGFRRLIDKQPTVDAIPIAVIKRAITGISLADQCDQAGRWDYELRSALQTVLKWYESPSYNEHEKRTQDGW